MPVRPDPTIADRIKEAGLACFAEKGFAGTTMAEIARRAGISPGSIYNSFASKRELFESLGRPDLDRPSPRSEERRREILSAALTVFAEKGYAGTSIDDLARAVGLSKAGLYAYFASKEELFGAVLSSTPQMDAARDLLSGATGRGRPTDPEGVFREFARGFLRVYDEPARLALLRLVLAEGGRSPDLAETFLAATVEQGSGLIGGVLAQFGYGSPAEMQPVARAWIGMLFSWVILNRVLSREPRQPKGEIVELSVRLLFQGIRQS